jgi:hypothetical protein
MASRRVGGFLSSVGGILVLAMDARFGIALELPAAQFWRYGGWVIPSGEFVRCVWRVLENW